MGMGYFSRDVNIYREVHIVGRGGGSSQYPNSDFRLAPLRSIVFHDVSTSPDGNWASSSVLEYCDIQTKAPLVGSHTQHPTPSDPSRDVDGADQRQGSFVAGDQYNLDGTFHGGILIGSTVVEA